MLLIVNSPLSFNEFLHGIAAASKKILRTQNLTTLIIFSANLLYYAMRALIAIFLISLRDCATFVKQITHIPTHTHAC